VLVGDPNQYSGRYMRYWNCVRFATEKYCRLANGKIQSGVT
jgi:hypothetical protein